MKEKNKVDTTKNLIPFNQLTEEQQREIAKKGAMKSVKDIKAIEFIRDTIGEKPKEEIELNTNNETFDSILSQLGGKGLNE